MYDFRDILAATKDEQIRAWSLEQAIESLSGMGLGGSLDILVNRADAIEQFVINGKKETRGPE